MTTDNIKLELKKVELKVRTGFVWLKIETSC